MGIQPITFDVTNAFAEGTGLTQSALGDLAPKLEAARDEVAADAVLWRDSSEVPPEKQPLDAGFIDLPHRLLHEYREKRDDSEVGQILATARRIADSVDRFVVLGIGGSHMGTRALFDACCHPYHNELSRAERGGKPRIYFEGNNVDNDAAAGLLDLFEGADPDKLEDKWGIVVISKSGGTLETAVSFRTFLSKLREQHGGDLANIAPLVVPVTGESGRLFDLSQAIGCPDVYHIPDGVGGRFSVLTAVGLLPAAILGLDIVALLEGAAEMTRRFKEEPAADNPVLQYCGLGELWGRQVEAYIRVLSVWGTKLEAIGLWNDQLYAESLGKEGRGALPLTVVNTRDLHSRGQQHQEGRRDKLITNVITDSYRRDPIAVGASDLDQDQLNSLSDKTMPQIMQAAIAGTNRAYELDGRPTCDLHLPEINESSLGQLFQMLMLATVTKGRMMGVNPYGQPGVEAYKKHMNAYLRGQE